jgi:hypothetical protein
MRAWRTPSDYGHVAPMAIVLVVLGTALWEGGWRQVLATYQMFLYIHGSLEFNLAFYLLTTLIVAIYPLTRRESACYGLLYVGVCALYLFQITYALLTQVVLITSSELRKGGLFRPEDSNIVLPLSLTLVGSIILLSFFARLPRNAVAGVLISVFVSALSATYQSYWVWKAIVYRTLH